jgi:hypothetical protein
LYNPFADKYPTTDFIGYMASLVLLVDINYLMRELEKKFVDERTLWPMCFPLLEQYKITLECMNCSSKMNNLYMLKPFIHQCFKGLYVGGESVDNVCILYVACLFA